MFDEKGQIIIAKEDCEMDADDLMMIALDAGAEDFLRKMTATRSSQIQMILRQYTLHLKQRRSLWQKQRLQ